MDGTGKTTLATALGEALGVDPLYHVTHDDLPEGQRYNVIDRHAGITNMVYKRALPKRFEHWPDLGAKPMLASDDLYVLLSYSPLAGNKVCDYTAKELEELDWGYHQALTAPCTGLLGKTVVIHAYSDAVHFCDYTAYQDLVRQTRITNGCELTERQAVEIKVREILNIIREAERRRHVAHK